MGALTALPPEAWFSVANSTALAAWMALVLLPRTPWLRGLLYGVVIGGLCLAYTTLVMVYFFSAGGGFGSLVAVQRLFTVREVALAGWLHYLAFDLFVGLWMAQRADAQGVSRWLQAPVLIVTFMFGPIGLLIWAAVSGPQARLARWLDSGAAPWETPR